MTCPGEEDEALKLSVAGNELIGEINSWQRGSWSWAPEFNGYTGCKGIEIF